MRRHITLRLQHHDQASLLSGTLHAVLQHAYAMGSNCYDLMWCLSAPSWPSPNLDFLNNALAQTGWGGCPITTRNWRSLVMAHLETLNWAHVRNEALPFLERPREVDLLTMESFAGLLETARE